MSIELPPMLREFLKGHAFALVSMSSNLGTVLVAKAPLLEIDSVRGRVSINVRYEVHNSVYGPVVRMVFVIYDRPHTPLILETFFNPSDTEQMADLVDLLGKDRVHVVFFDEMLTHRLTKTVRQPKVEELRALAPQVRKLLARADPTEIDFDMAKRVIQDANPIEDEG